MSMATGQITFNLPEEQEEFDTAVNASKWKNVVWELKQELRKTTKYGKNVNGEGEATQEEVEIVEKVTELLFEIMQENNVKFD